MEFIEVVAGKDDGGRRLDRILKRILLEEFSIYKPLKAGLIKVNGKKISENMRIAEGDVIKIAKFLIKNNTFIDDSNYTFKYSVIFKNDFILAINKPYGKDVQKNISQDVKKLYFQTKSNNSIAFVPGPIHRLDCRTTGLLLFSQNLEGAVFFQKAMSSHVIKKTYIAIVQGKLEKKNIWQDLIVKEQQKTSFYTVKSNLSGKKAVTEVLPLGYGKYKDIEVSLVQFMIKTGRKHQIRYQSSKHGFPLLGDNAYNALKINEIQQLFLHAVRMDFPDNNPCNMPPFLEAEVPEEFKQMLKKCHINFDFTSIYNYNE